MKKKHCHFKSHKSKPTLSLLSLKIIIKKKFINNYSSKNSKIFFPFNTLITEAMINNKGCHIVSIFKDYMIRDYIKEFLKREYTIAESKERMVKLSTFYKNYCYFFCKPTFRNFRYNSILGNYYEQKAEIFYKQNLQKSKNEKNKKEELNDFNINTFESEENFIDVSLSKIEKTIFNSKLKNEIDNSVLFSPNISKKITKENETLALDDNKKIKEDFNNIGNAYLISKNSTETSMVNMIRSMSSNEIKTKKNNFLYNRKKSENKIVEIIQILPKSRNNNISRILTKNLTQTLRKRVISNNNNNNNINNNNKGVTTQNIDIIIQSLNKKLQLLSKKTAFNKYQMNKPRSPLKNHTRNPKFVENIIWHNIIKSKAVSPPKTSQNASIKNISHGKVPKASDFIKKPINLIKKSSHSKSIMKSFENVSEREIKKQRSQISLFKKENGNLPYRNISPKYKEENKNNSVSKGFNGIKSKTSFNSINNNRNKGRNVKRDLGSNNFHFASFSLVGHKFSKSKSNKKISL